MEEEEEEGEKEEVGHGEEVDGRQNIIFL